MNIQILREFCDVAETMNFGKTSMRMYISQPALSKHIMMLEKELGVQLFIRDKQNGLKLTSAGSYFVGEAQHILQAYDHAFSVIRQRYTDCPISLRIGFLDSAVHILLSKFIDDFRQKYPSASLTLESCTLQTLTERLEHNEIDIGFTILFPNSDLPDHLEFVSLYEDELAAIVPDQHPLAKLNQVSFSELFENPLILPSEKQFPIYVSLLKQFVETANVDLNVICDYFQIQAAIIMVEGNMGVSVMPINTQSHAVHARFIPISDCNITLPVGLLYKKSNPSKGIKLFLDSVIETMNQIELGNH